jgi:hypothetical protein
MSVESALAGELQKAAEVAALIANRVYPVVAPQASAVPFVTYRRSPGEVLYTQEGESSVQKAFFQIAAAAETYETAITLAAAIRTGLSGKRSLGDGHITFNGIFFQDPEDAWNQETGLFVRTQGCTILYRKGV